MKGIGFDPSDPDGPCGADIFARLVPYSAHEAASLYSEEKAKLLRTVGEEVDCRDAELAEFLSALDLEEVPRPDAGLSLPQEVVECAAGLSVKGGGGEGGGAAAAVQRLEDAMDRIDAISQEVESGLKEIKEMLEHEAEEEESCAALVGGRRPTPLNSEIEAERRKLEEAHAVAKESNSALSEAVEVHLDQLRLLARPLEELQGEVPSMADLDEESEANIAEVFV